MLVNSPSNAGVLEASSISASVASILSKMVLISSSNSTLSWVMYVYISINHDRNAAKASRSSTDGALPSRR